MNFVDVLPAFLLATVAAATPLLLAALGELIGERAGVINVGLEGLILIACAAGFLVAEATGSSWLGLAAAAGAPAPFAAAFGWCVVSAGVDAVVAGTALNLLALGLTASVFRIVHGATGAALVVESLPPALLPSVALALVPLVAAFLMRTRAGLITRACGEDGESARALGLAVERVRFRAILFTGLACGLAGAHLALVEARTFVEGMSAGRGFLALAVVVCGRKSPFGALLAALLFGGAGALQFQFQAAGSGVPYQVFLVLPYVVTLVVLAVVLRRHGASDSVASSG